MITIAKLKEYETYRGYYDGFYIQKVKQNTNINSDRDWYLIAGLMQDFTIINNGFASDEFIERANVRLKEICENPEAIEYFKTLGTRLATLSK